MLKKALFSGAQPLSAICTSHSTSGHARRVCPRLILHRTLASTPPLAVKSDYAKQRVIDRLERQKAYEEKYLRTARHPLAREAEKPYRPYKLSGRIFVRGIPDFVEPWDAENKLHEMFTPFGEVLSIELDETRRPGNYRCAFVKFRTTDSAQAAIAVCEKEPLYIENNHMLQVESFNPTRQLKERLYFSPMRFTREDLDLLLSPYQSQIERLQTRDVRDQENVIHGHIDFKTVEGAKRFLEGMDDKVVFGAFGAAKLRIAFSAKESLKYKVPQLPQTPVDEEEEITGLLPNAPAQFSRASKHAMPPGLTSHTPGGEVIRGLPNAPTKFSRASKHEIPPGLRSHELSKPVPGSGGMSRIDWLELSPKKRYGRSWQKKEQQKLARHGRVR
ncbi:hypothetical protein OE88DRAFT_1731729 [Heliocybe sulcata]|uniref:RRM domain-containing protein n=1 Tax=Heliocybe sulcata TaxID=5364 RepID=A0A5C3NFH4_9AGAM|nr:hypothetical protein OE88DRAFT_1731729 [Heliocybe sulcata]